MQIGFTGAHGTGKTTLAEALSTELSKSASATVCREAPRLVIESVGDDGFFKRGSNTLERQILVFLYHVIEERRAEMEAVTVVADRTLVDHLAYTFVLFPDCERTLEILALKKAAFKSLAGYDFIFKLPVEFRVVDDGVRESDHGFQAQIDQAIDRLYVEAGAEPFVIRGSVRSRLDDVLAHIRKPEKGTG